MLYKDCLKPLADRLFALILLVVFSPIMLLCALVIRLKLGTPILFTQNRPGLKGKIFKIYKFRTMSNATDSEGNLLSDAERLKGIGVWIRKASLDELPQLFNVLKGEMSFIGPRPLLPEYLELYTKEESRRHDVLPGITGLAQVNGRNAIEWEEKFTLDVKYVDTLSFSLDVEIFFLTFKKVFIREGINAQGQATIAKFEGSTKRAAIYGAGGHAKVVADIAQSLGYDIVAVIDQQEGKEFCGLHTICEEAFLQQKGIRSVFLGIGNNAIRADIFHRLRQKGYHFPPLIHKSAHVSLHATLQEGSIIFPHAVVNPQAHIGKGVIINSACVIEHDNIIGDFSHISPNATLAGGVKIGKLTHIGAGSVIRELIEIGSSVVIGAGSVVVSCVADNKKIVGNPAKRELP